MINPNEKMGAVRHIVKNGTYLRYTCVGNLVKVSKEDIEAYYATEAVKSLEVESRSRFYTIREILEMDDPNDPNSNT